MKRKASILLLLAGLTGWVSPALAGKYMSGAFNQTPEGVSIGPRVVLESGFVGPYGQPVATLPTETTREPTGPSCSPSRRTSASLRM